jgi:hypothetical protein
MMTKEQYVKHCKENCIPSSRGEANWKKWKDDDAILKDADSEGEDRIRVKTGDDVDYVEKFGVRKKLQLLSKSVKNPTQQDVAKLSKKAVTNHEGLLEDAGFDLKKVAGHMVAGGKSGGAFHASACVVPNVRDLLPSPATKEKQKTGGGGAGASSNGKDPAQEGSDAEGEKLEEQEKTVKDGRGRHWEGDRAIALAQTNSRNQARSSGVGTLVHGQWQVSRSMFLRLLLQA